MGFVLALGLYVTIDRSKWACSCGAILFCSVSSVPRSRRVENASAWMVYSLRLKRQSHHDMPADRSTKPSYEGILVYENELLLRTCH